MKDNKSSPSRKRTRLWPLVMIYEHDDCAEHETGTHQEGADRLQTARRALTRIKGVDFTSSFPLANDAALERVHSRSYLDLLEQLESEFASGVRGPIEPLSPRVIERMFPSSTPTGMTLVSRGTVRAAKRAAGAVVSAIDDVIAALQTNGAVWDVTNGKPHAAFCLVRPPGHHSTVDGFDPVAGGCGFCVLNSVAVGAAHAIHTYSMRVAIVDFDVHHGNGTENIMIARLASKAVDERSRVSKPRAPCQEPKSQRPSEDEPDDAMRLCHKCTARLSKGVTEEAGIECDGRCRQRLALGTPVYSCVACDYDVCERCCAPPTPPVINPCGLKWGRGALFCSTHLYEHFEEQPDFDFFPGRGGRTEPKLTAGAQCDSAAGGGANPSAVGTSCGEAGGEAGPAAAPEQLGPVLNLPLEPLWQREKRKGSKPSWRGRLGFRAAIADELLPALRSFQPDLLLFSAGFDGADGDDGNTQDEVGGLDLTDADFGWATAAICAAAGEHLSAPLPVVSVLEGGYGRWNEETESYDRKSLAGGVAAHVASLRSHVVAGSGLLPSRSSAD